LEGEARISRDHEQRFEPRQRGDDLLDHPVGKVLLLWIAAHVLERQYGDRRLVRKLRNRTKPPGQCAMRARGYGISANGLGDVLEVLLAAILQATVQLAVDLAVTLLGHQDAARIGDPFQPDSDIDPVAIELAVLADDYVTKVQPDAQREGTAA